MNWLIFIGGAGAGALLATILLLGVIRLCSRRSAEQDRAALEHHKRAGELLEERNQISAKQLEAIRAIAMGYMRQNRARPAEDPKAEAARKAKRLAILFHEGRAPEDYNVTLADGSLFFVMIRSLGDPRKDLGVPATIGKAVTV